MRLIQEYLPNPRHTEINRIFVKAKPAEAWGAARHFDACRLYTRVRADGTPKWKEWLLAGLYYPPVHALMERTQLKYIQQFAERDARAR